MINKLALMARGHEIRLENSKMENGEVEHALVYGRNILQGGMGDQKGLKAFVYCLDGTRSEPSIISGETGHLARFKEDKPGCYSAFTDMGSK